MSRVSRTRVIETPVERVWELVADPYHLPRWWPRCVRVEDVREAAGSGRARWTAVLQTGRGGIVRADYRRVSAAEPTRLIWEQETEGTPFERILRESRLELGLEPAGGATRLTLTARQRLRGLSRLGSPMMRRGSGRTLEEALDGVQRVLKQD